MKICIKTVIYKIALPIILLGFNQIAIAASASTIRIGVSDVGTGGRPVVGNGALANVHINGLLEEEFKKDGIKIEWNFFKGAGPAVNEALANKLIDFAWQGDLPAIVAKAGGMKTKIILPTGKFGTSYLFVPNDSNAKSFADLKGKKLAIFKGTNLQLALSKVLDAQGLAEKDFRTINMDAATAMAALATKDVDAAWFTLGAFPLVDRGIAKIIYEAKGQPPAFTRQGHFLVTEEFEKSNPQLVQRVVNVIVKKSAEISDDKNTDKTLQEWAKSGIPYATWKKDLVGSSLKQRVNPLLDEFFIQFYEDSMQSALKYKLIRKEFDVKSWFEPKYVNQSLKELKLENYWDELDKNGRKINK